MFHSTRSGFARLAALALALAAVPLLATWVDWRPAVPQPLSLEGWPTPPGGAWERSDQIVVDFRDNLPAAQLRQLAGGFGIRSLDDGALDRPMRLMRASVAPGQQSAVLARLRQDSRVEAAEPLRLYTTFWAPNDTRYKEQWNFKLINMEKAWDVARGKGAVVAVIDTGVALENDAKCYQAKDFASTKFVRGYDFVGRDDHPKDDHGHGTHVGGTIAESTDNREGVAGIAFEAKLMGLKVLTAEGWGTSADIAEAIRFAADHGAHVINMSLGSPVPDRVMQSACEYARKKGVIIVCAAGNSGREGVGFPAAFKECIAVSAVGPKGDLSFYSSWGKEVAIAAPGGDTSHGPQFGILQNTVAPDDGYYFFQGTSMASPHVAGVAALLVSQGVKDPDQVKAILQKTASAKGPKKKYGAGVLDAAAAVKAAQEVAREPYERLGFGLFLGAFGLGLAAFRTRAARHMGLPLTGTVLFLVGMLLPEALAASVGSSSLVNVLGHSALIPLGLLALKLDTRPYLRGLAAVSAGFAAHLVWDAVRFAAPFSLQAGLSGLPWLAVNAVIATVIAVAALRKGYADE